ncbi:MAG: DNA methyltransferase [Candidatus Njordarchaeia archaeon]|nr:methyltransferase domain-containing protein [Candidatus Korarchaeota archaeon]
MGTNEIRQYIIRIVRGYERLGIEELRSITEAYNEPFKVYRSVNDYYFIKTTRIGAFLSAYRAGFLTYMGEILSASMNEESDSINWMKIFTTNECVLSTFKINIIDHSKILDRENKRTLLRKIIEEIKRQNPNVIVDLENPSHIIDVLVIDTNMQFILLHMNTARKRLAKRDSMYKPYSPPASMNVYLSRALINLARTLPGHIFLDPFCGSGSLLIEAALIGAKAYGIDISPISVWGARFNSKIMGVDFDVRLGDALDKNSFENQVDAIATDPPYGREASTYGLDIQELYSKFFKNACRILKKGRYMAVCAPEGIPIIKMAEEYGFSRVFVYKERVNKALTRLITVFKLI